MTPMLSSFMDLKIDLQNIPPAMIEVSQAVLKKKGIQNIQHA